MKTTKNPTESLRAIQAELEAAVNAAETATQRLADLRSAKDALASESAKPLDPLDRAAVSKRSEALTQVGAIEDQVVELAKAQAECEAAIQRALQAVAIPFAQVAADQAKTTEQTLVENLAPLCRDVTKARHVANQVDALVYLRHATNIWWSQASDATTGRWVLKSLLGRVLGEEPLLWPPPPRLEKQAT